MIDFLVNNWHWLLCLVLCLVELLLVIFKKSIKFDTVREKIMAFLPVCISLAEEVIGSGNGSKKKDYVIALIKSSLDLKDDYDSFISSAIESILSTPTKK